MRLRLAGAGDDLFGCQADAVIGDLHAAVAGTAGDLLGAVGMPVEQIAVAARDSGMEVVYEGIRLTPARIAHTALEEGVHLVGLSILSGSHMPLVGEVLERMRELGIGEVPLVVGGIVPPADAERLRAAGVARVYTPKDFAIPEIMADLVEVVLAARRRAA